MEIIDCHVHIDKGLENYDLNVTRKNVIFNSIDNYKKFKHKLLPSDFISLIFDYKNSLEYVLNESTKINAYKIHSRFQKISTEKDYDHLIKNLRKADKKKPIIMDAFYYGSDIDFQPNLSQYIRIIKAFPNRKFVIAHSGGYKVIEYFFHLRDLDNVFYDLSVSLQYLVDTSYLLDLKKLIHYTNKDKILFGSDYPYAKPKLQFKILSELCEELNLSIDDKNQIFQGNTHRLFNI